MSVSANKTILFNRLNFPCRMHFVGVGGIGMSGIAQLCIQMGCTVSGSDRSLGKAESEGLFTKLRNAGVKLFPQDGSVYKEQIPDVIVYSTAIENDNPDFLNAPEGTLKIHRSMAISYCIAHLQGRHILAITGTCGKTTTSAWISDALKRLNAEPGMLTGGAVKLFRTSAAIGNGELGSGQEFIIEADESDKSLLNYVPSTAVILNIGTDHYSREELCTVFRQFANSAKENVIIQDKALLEIGPDTLSNRLHITIFTADKNSAERIAGHKVHRLTSYRTEKGRSFCSFDHLPEIQLPLPGIHNAINALALFCTLLARGYKQDDILKVIPLFSGVERRFDHIGTTSSGAIVIDDYAHNVEKIASCIKAAQELTGKENRVFTIFQPHGFSALRFMRNELIQGIANVLRKQDVFCFLPVYYAGGTTSFTPTSDEVAQQCASICKDPNAICTFNDRDALRKYLQNNATNGDFILILGARDPSLTEYCKSLVSI